MKDMFGWATDVNLEGCNKQDKIKLMGTIWHVNTLEMNNSQLCT